MLRHTTILVGMLLVGAGGVDGGVRLGVAGLKEIVLNHPLFDFFAADVGQHGAVHFHAGGEGLTALLLHFPAKSGIFDDVLLIELEVILSHDGTDAFAPPTKGFEVGRNLRFFVAHGVIIRVSVILATILRLQEFQFEFDLPKQPPRR